MIGTEELRKGQVLEALAATEQALRKAPRDVGLALRLFDLLTVCGSWDRAARRLQILGDLGEKERMLSTLLQSLLGCEMRRLEVFLGKTNPDLHGEPCQWEEWLIEANRSLVEGNFEEAASLRDKALNSAPQARGKRGEQKFNWLVDADSRLGPVLEVVLDNKYGWLPFSSLTRLEVKAPDSLRDRVWASAKVTLTDGKERIGIVPTRYPQTELLEDPVLLLSQKTAWTERPFDFYLGLGQRVLMLDETAVPILEMGAISLEHQN